MSLKKSSLGRGLSALIPDANESRPHTSNSNSSSESGISSEQIRTSILDLELKKIVANPDQPRSFFPEDKLQELADSIKSFGVIEPIIVQKDPSNSGCYRIIAGERRYRATELAGFDTIPAVVKDDVGENLLELMLIENIQREDLTPIEEARSYQAIINRKKITQEELAATLGKSRPHVTNMLRILKLPAEIQNHINNGNIPMGQARVLVGLKKDIQEKIIAKILDNQISTREVEKMARVLSEKTSESTENVSRETTPKNLGRDPNMLKIEDDLRDYFKTKVTLHELSGKSGKIEIEYYSYEDLDNLLNKIPYSK